MARPTIDDATRGRSIRPARSLTHPLFVGALATLALNDHVLKGSAMLPGAVTGKLSDVAGLLVAPLALAWLLRVGSRRGWIAVHVAVGALFALAQVGAVAGALEEVARALGLGARFWADPTDLLALPILAVSFHLFGRARAPRRAEAAIGVLALALCTATPAPGGQRPPRYPFPPAGHLESDVYLRHTGSQDLVIGVRRLRDEVTVDCDGLLDEPERMLEGGDFGEEQEWTLARGDAVPLWDRRGGANDRECYAVRLRARGREWLVTWRDGAPAMRPIDIRLEPNEPAEDAAVVLAGDAGEPPRVPEGVTVRAPQ